MNFGELAKFPTEDDDWLMTVLIGGVLIFFSWLVVPLLLVYGYVVRVMRGAIEGETEPPSFDDWGGFARDGLFAAIIGIVYQIVPAVVGGGLLFVSTVLLATGSESGAGLSVIGFILSYGVWLVLSLVFGYLGFAGILNFASEGTLGAAFDVGAVKAVATSKEYLVAWLFYLAISFGAGIVSVFVITAPFAYFYAYSAGGRAMGEAYASAVGPTVGTEQAATGAPA